MRIAGVPARLHPTAVLFIVLVAWSAGREVAATQVYDGAAWAKAIPAGGPLLMAPTSPGTGWTIVAAIGGALVVLGSLALSGLAHLAVVRRAGLRPVEMLLFFLGGQVRCAEDESGRERSTLEVVTTPLVLAGLALAAWVALHGPLGAQTLHGRTALVESALLRACMSFNALVLATGLVLQLAWLLRHARRRRVASGA